MSAETRPESYRDTMKTLEANLTESQTVCRLTADMGLLDFAKTLPEGHPLAAEIRDVIEEIHELRSIQEDLKASLDAATAEWVIFHDVDTLQGISLRKDTILSVYETTDGNSMIYYGTPADPTMVVVRGSPKAVLKAWGVRVLEGPKPKAPGD